MAGYSAPVPVFLMESDMKKLTGRLKFVEQLRPFVADEDAYGRVYADLHDLMVASEWLLAEIDQKRDEPLTAEKIEDFLIDLDVRYIQHVTFHLTSLRKDLDMILAKLDQRSGSE